MIRIPLIFAAAALSVASAAAGAAPLPAPVLGRSVNAAPVSGTVKLTVPGGKTAVLSAPRQIPVGSVLDAAGGSVQVTAADSGTAPPYSGDFRQGEFRVAPSASGDGSTQIGVLGACTRAVEAGVGPAARVAAGSPAATVSAKPHHHIRRFLSITADGKFVIVGANATASGTGAASWVVNDNCDGSTSVEDHRGRVRAVARGGVSKELAPGQSDAVYCHLPGQAPPTPGSTRWSTS